jgi:hypothetical protein
MPSSRCLGVLNGSLLASLGIYPVCTGALVSSYVIRTYICARAVGPIPLVPRRHSPGCRRPARRGHGARPPRGVLHTARLRRAGWRPRVPRCCAPQTIACLPPAVYTQNGVMSDEWGLAGAVAGGWARRRRGPPPNEFGARGLRPRSPLRGLGPASLCASQLALALAETQSPAGDFVAAALSLGFQSGATSAAPHPPARLRAGPPHSSLVTLY